MTAFKLKSNYKPTGDQPRAITNLSNGIKAGLRDQVLLGVTGSGKTFTMANVIQNIQKPTLVISHNKTLAAQLTQEFKEYFPQNAVEYFVSYYDYYQPEAYVPQTDTYIAKETQINDLIDKLRLSSTTSLLTRQDVVIVASVSCIYNIGSPMEYGRYLVTLKKGGQYPREGLFKDLIRLRYERNDFEPKRGSFSVRGEVVTIYPAWQDDLFRITFLGNTIESLYTVERVSGKRIREEDGIAIYPAKHYLTAEERQKSGIELIKSDLQERIEYFRDNDQLLEAQRIEERTNYDIEMMEQVGYCSGIENYSRYFDGRSPGEAPFTLLDYFPKDYLLIIDESHITVPQIRGMYFGDRSRKQTLIDFGFRLPSAIDNRPLRFTEFWSRVNQAIYTSATPEEFEYERASAALKDIEKNKTPEQLGKLLSSYTTPVEQLVRPTGILDPEIEIRKTEGQIPDLIIEVAKRVEKKERVLITTLTKRMAEDLTDYLKERDISVQYIHADVETLERTNILEKLRSGEFDVLVGINLLREGLDLPEVSLVVILDADKEGFLRSERSLIQVMGRAARHLNGKVIMYADNRTKSMDKAINEVDRRRNIQKEYNVKNNITPTQIVKPIRKKLIDPADFIKEDIGDSYKKGKEIGIDSEFDMEKVKKEWVEMLPPERTKLLRTLENQMRYYAKELLFEEAAILRDQIKNLKTD